jgi:hypothetical protein
MDFITNNSMLLILLVMDYTKMILSGKLSAAIIIITMLEILLKKMVHIANVSNFYTY